MNVLEIFHVVLVQACAEVAIVKKTLIALQMETYVKMVSAELFSTQQLQHAQRIMIVLLNKSASKKFVNLINVQ